MLRVAVPVVVVVVLVVVGVVVVPVVVVPVVMLSPGGVRPAQLLQQRREVSAVLLLARALQPPLHLLPAVHLRARARLLLALPRQHEGGRSEIAG